MRLIDADALKRLVDEEWFDCQEKSSFFDEIDRTPTIDPVKHGKWVLPRDEGCVTYDERAYAECSICGKKSFLGWSDKYCRNCGARMEADE